MIAAMLAAMEIGRRLMHAARIVTPRWAGALPAYAIGGMGGFWLVDRIAGFAA
jgi:hypothetical protein